MVRLLSEVSLFGYFLVTKINYLRQFQCYFQYLNILGFHKRLYSALSFHWLNYDLALCIAILLFQAVDLYQDYFICFIFILYIKATKAINWWHSPLFCSYYQLLNVASRNIHLCLVVEIILRLSIEWPMSIGSRLD